MNNEGLTMLSYSVLLGFYLVLITLIFAKLFPFREKQGGIHIGAGAENDGIESWHNSQAENDDKTIGEFDEKIGKRFLHIAKELSVRDEFVFESDSVFTDPPIPRVITDDTYTEMVMSEAGDILGTVSNEHEFKVCE